MMGEGACPVCDGTRIVPFLHRDRVPVHQNLVVPDREAARGMTRGELDLAVCEDCGFVWNRAFDLSLLAYGAHYDNTQACSAYFEAYVDGLVRDLVEVQGVRDCAIVEVGCGKGQFLKKLVDFPGSGNRGYGFDPSYVGPETFRDGRVTFRRCYYDGRCTDVRADVVVCRHVIEHVPDPLALLGAVRAALGGSGDARVFFETPCVDWILRHQVVWDFFYEHCSLFTAASLGFAFARAGFAVKRVAHLFGGQYLWLEARPAVGRVEPVPSPGETVALARGYGAGEAALKERWRDRLTGLRRQGNVALWGAGAKGATFANLVDPEPGLLDCVVDLNPNKQGRCIPGTGHPIVAPPALAERGVRNVVLMNPNYRDEIGRLVADLGLEITLLDWSDR